MKYCTNCGAGLDDDAGFCTECGAKQGSADPGSVTGDFQNNDNNGFSGDITGDVPDGTQDGAYRDIYNDVPAAAPKKPFFKRPLGIVVIVVAALLVAGGIVFACVMGSPKVMLARAAMNTARDVQQIKVLKFMNAVGEEGSVTVSVNLDEILESYGIDVKGDLVCTEYFDKSKSSTAITADLKVHGSSAADATLWVSPESLIVNSKVLLGKDAYGIGVAAIPKNIKGSDLGDVIPDDVYDAIDEADPRIFESEEECRQIITDYFSDVAQHFYAQALKNAEFSKSSDSVDFASSSVKATVVTMTIDEDIMQDALKDTIKYAEKDEKFDEARDLLASYLEFCAIAAGEDDADGEDLLDELFEELDDAADELDNMEVESRFYIYRSRLVKAEIEDSKTDSEVSITLGPDPSDPELCEITIYSDYSDGDSYREEIDICMGWEVETNTASEYEASLYVKEYGRKNRMDISWDRKNGDFSAKVKDLGTLSGTMNTSKDEVELSLEKVKVFGDKQDLEISILLKTKDSMPQAPEYTEILKMDRDELEEVGRDVIDGLEDVMDELEE